MVDVRIERIGERLLAHEPRLLPRTGDSRSAAVAALVRPSGDDAEVLLIRRSESPNDPWSGHMAFPGGRQDPGDEDLLATAVRETLEEVGLDLHAIARPLGHLDEIDALARGKRAGLIVRPYVFELRSGVNLDLVHNHEVAEIVWARLGPLARGESGSSFRFQRDGYDVSLPAYDVDGRTVWGLTYQMLLSLFERLR